MEEVAVDTQATIPAPPTESLEAMLARLLAPITKKLEAAEQRTVELEAKLTAQSEANFGAENIRFSQDTSGKAMGGSFARRVTLRTKPVEDHPEDYNNVVESGGLVKNSISY